MQNALLIVGGILAAYLLITHVVYRYRIGVYQSFNRALVSALTGNDFTAKDRPHQFASWPFDPSEVTEEFIRKLSYGNDGPESTYRRFFSPELPLSRMTDFLEFLYCMSTARQNLAWLLGPHNDDTSAEDIASAINDFIEAINEGFQHKEAEKLLAVDPRPVYAERLLNLLAIQAKREGAHVISVSTETGLRFVMCTDKSTVTIGGVTSDDIFLDSKGALPSHAKISFNEKGAWLDSPTGKTLVNGHPMKSGTITDRDVIAIGPVLLRILA